MVSPLLLVLSVILPDVALEPIDSAQRGHVEQVSPGPCGADSAMQLLIEGDGPRRIGRQLDVESFRGKRIEISTRIVARGTEVVPALKVEVRAGTPPRSIGVFSAVVKKACEAVTVQVDVPDLATELDMGVVLESPGLLLVEPIKVRELGLARPLDWSRVAWRGVVGSWSFNEGFIRSPRPEFSFRRQEPAGTWLAQKAALKPLEKGRWWLELDAHEGELSVAFESKLVRVEGTWNGRPVRIAVTPTEVEINDGGSVRTLRAQAERKTVKGCFFYRSPLEPDRVLCGLFARDVAMPQALVALAGELLR